MVKQTAGKEKLGDFAPKFAEINDDILFGEIWSREDKLSLRDRSLITICIFMGKGLVDNSLKYHLTNARNNGITKEEMAEIITHAAFYAGWPNAWAVFNLAKEVYADDDNRFGSLSTGVSQDNLLNYDQDSAHSKYFTAWISYDSDYDLSNKTVEITLKNLTEEGNYDKAVITDGTWDFKWTLGAVNPPTTLEVNRKCDFGGYEITVKKMEVTPLLWSLYLDYDEAMKVYEDEKNKFEYAGTDYGMDLYDRANIDQVRYKDGTVLTLDLTMGGIAGGGEKQDKENGVMIIRNSFPQLVDVDNLQAVHFGNIDQWLEVRE